MNDTTLSAIDALIDSFEKNTYTEKHVKSLLQYLVDLDPAEDKETITAIIKVLGFCTKDFVREPIIETLRSLEDTDPVKAWLVAVCWESGLDYAAYLDVFVTALLKGSELTAIEAYTMILEFTQKNEQVKKAIEDITKTDQLNYSPAHRILINDSLQHLINLYTKEPA